MKKYDSIRIFQNPVLESLTHVHPLIPLLLWGPVVAYLFAQSYLTYHLELGTYVGILITGLLSWTLTEYLLHRYVFHFPATGPVEIIIRNDKYQL